MPGKAVDCFSCHARSASLGHSQLVHAPVLPYKREWETAKHADEREMNRLENWCDSPSG